MPTGCATPTNKTEFMRYLNDYGVMVGPLRKRRREYSTCSNSMTTARDTFGMWLRTKYRAEFDSTYNAYWLNNPHLYGKVYATPTL